MEKLAGKPFLTLYEAEDVENVKIDEGEWRVSMTTSSQRLVFPIAEITFEFGTSYPGNSVECTGSLIWGEPFAANNKTFKFVDEYDLAQVYCGNEWRLPTVEEANLLVGSCTIEKCELDGVHQVGLFYTDDKAIAMVSTITSGEEYYILPVKDATE